MRLLSTLLAVALLGAQAAARADAPPTTTCACPSAESARPRVQIVADRPPPPLPDTDQTPLPGPGFIWTPGYWAWNNQDYYWSPGAWVEPPQSGLLWTPPYWAWEDGVYVFHAGAWGPHVGFYGGLAYGFGYYGAGYTGARWKGGELVYNRAVNRFGKVEIADTFDEPAPQSPERASFNGGPQGAQAKPTADELAADKDTHSPPTVAQRRLALAASWTQAAYASVNNGKPGIVEAAEPASLSPPAVPPEAPPGGPLTAAPPPGLTAATPSPKPAPQAMNPPHRPTSWRAPPRHGPRHCTRTGAGACAY
jgi:hypothetical protein